jgi:hypothetical protein
MPRRWLHHVFLLRSDRQVPRRSCRRRHRIFCGFEASRLPTLLRLLFQSPSPKFWQCCNMDGSPGHSVSLFQQHKQSRGLELEFQFATSIDNGGSDWRSQRNLHTSGSGLFRGSSPELCSCYRVAITIFGQFLFNISMSYCSLNCRIETCMNFHVLFVHVGTNL